MVGWVDHTIHHGGERGGGKRNSSRAGDRVAKVVAKKEKRGRRKRVTLSGTSFSLVKVRGRKEGHMREGTFLCLFFFLFSDCCCT